MSKQEQLFQLWLDNNLSEQQQVEFEQLIEHDQTMQDRLNTARVVEQQVYCYEPKSVPNWDPANVFESDKKPWWQWPGLSIISLSCSIFAVLLVVFNVEFSQQQDGLMVRFGNNDNALNEAKIQQVIDKRLSVFATEQELAMVSFREDIKANQQTNNLDLVTYLLASTRTERQQDISNFIQYVNEQRNEDAIDQKIRYQKLQLQLNGQALTTPRAKPMNINHSTDQE